MKRDAGIVGKLFQCWENMHRRCTEPKNNSWGNYGGRGISISDEWYVFDNFFLWAMDNEYQIGLELDRVDVNGNYEPDNCRFVTRVENSRNKRNSRYFEAFGEKKLLTQWAEDDRCVVEYGALRTRIYQYEWSMEKALTTPNIKNPKRNDVLYEYQGDKKTVANWAKDPRCVVTYSTLNARVGAQWVFETALTTPLVRPKEAAHGTISRYKGEYNCRCEPCVHAMSVYGKLKRKQLS